MLYILTGEDDFSLNETLKEIKKSIGDESLISVNIAMLEGETLKAPELVAVSNALPFMTGNRLVIVRGLLQRFETQRKAVRRPPSKTTGDGNGHKPFAAAFRSLPESTILVLVDEDIQRDNPLFDAIKDIAKVNSYPLLQRSRLNQWIETRVKSAGGSITSNARELLAKTVGSNLWIMSNEVDKLLSFAKDRAIEESDVLSLVTDARESNIFALVDSVFDGNHETVQNALQKLLTAGASPTHILFMIARQLQLFIRTKDMKRRNRSRAEIQKRLGLADFPFQKTMAQSERHSFQRMKEVYQKLLQTDLAIKTGKYEDELALNILVAELCSKV